MNIVFIMLGLIFIIALWIIVESISSKVDKRMKVVIYGKKACPFCVSAKELCEAREIDYEYIDFVETGMTKEDLEKIVGKPVKTVPQIFVDDKHIGGFNELDALLDPALPATMGGVDHGL